MKMKTVDFYWDPASPFTYLAATRLRNLATETNTEFIWKPFLIGGVFKATGNQPPVTVPAKGNHMFVDLRRWAKLYDVPFTIPESFPINSVPPTRFAIAAANMGARAESVAMRLMSAHWGEGRDISQPDVMAEIAGQLELDFDAITAAMATDEVKAELRRNTDEAIERGAFGAPTFYVDDQLFWGNDRLELLRAYLTGRLAA